MTKNLLKKVTVTFIASVGVAVFALALAPTVAQAKVSKFIRIVPGYTAPGYKAPSVYRPATTIGYRVTPIKVIPGYKAPGYRSTSTVQIYRPGR